MKLNYPTANRLKFFCFIVFLCFCMDANAQIWDKISDGAKKIQKAATDVTNTTNAVTSTYRAVKQSWKRDTSSNIKYQQVPDYRNREEVSISKKQKLSIENGNFRNLTWSPVTKFDNQVFPSFILGWATYKGEKEEDMGSSLGFNINTNLPNVVLKWEIECADKSYFNIDSGYIRYDDMRATNKFMPRISWNFRELTKHKISTPLNVYFRLIDPNSGKKVEKLVNINIRSINDCLLYYNNQSYNYLFASYVNEEHPEIDKILKKMLDTKMINNVAGYQLGPGYVDLQVAALWRVLHDRGFQYSSITDNSGFNDASGQGVFSQTVRTFENSLQTNQANCVDGTVFIASVLKRMGIKPILVNVPGHCFLGYYTSDKLNAEIHFLETTMLAGKTYISNPKSSVLKYNKLLLQLIPKGVKLSEINKAYYLEFFNAQLTGAATYKKDMANYGGEKVKMLDVSQLRKYVAPIPFYE